MECVTHGGPSLQGAPWWLYGQDLELARDLQHQAIASCEPGEQRLSHISILSYLGDYQGCSDWLDQVRGREHVSGRQSEYRIRRYRRIPNPWRALLEPDHEEWLCATLVERIKERQPIVVDLVGGIGDQLENAALLLSVQTQLPPDHQVMVRALGENAQVVEQLLLQTPGLRVQAREACSQSWRITAPWFRYWLGRSGIAETIHRPLLVDQAPVDATAPLLVCWRSKPDPSNPLSSFSRSLPFAAILELLERWQSSAEGLGLRLIDISDYSAAEAQQIQQHHGWVDLARNRIRSLDDTRHLMGKAAAIATVDTSLGHLSVLCGRPVHLLLPLWPDERWYDLLEGGIYRKLVSTYQQQQFHCWRQPLEALSRQLRLSE